MFALLLHSFSKAHAEGKQRGTRVFQRAKAGIRLIQVVYGSLVNVRIQKVIDTQFKRSAWRQCLGGGYIQPTLTIQGKLSIGLFTLILTVCL